MAALTEEYGEERRPLGEALRGFEALALEVAEGEAVAAAEASATSVTAATAASLTVPTTGSSATIAAAAATAHEAQRLCVVCEDRPREVCECARPYRRLSVCTIRGG